MKNVFVVLKKKFLVCVLVVLMMATGVLGVVGAKKTMSPKPQFAIVVDAGHGGVDGGAVGSQTGITENELNLQFAQTLKQICQEYGWKVVLTRSDLSGLYSPLASNKKRSEMEKRKEIIEKSKADLVVSIHMNSFADKSVCGANVFYAKESVQGQMLANAVQGIFFETMQVRNSKAKVGDYYILNCADKPSILIECGFLSNDKEELLLQDKDYQQQMCYAIFCGILKYFESL